ncbi:MAG: rod shape-determining protein MreC [Bacillota bacterium]|nr:rod shape-determining protein MreC [Bacillota bacterium]MDP4170812.1 rod shape-determining protein MreC [Bacillota bacterium]
MPQFFLNKRLIVLLVSIIILVALIGFSLRDRTELTWPEKFVKDTVGWVQFLVSKPAHSVAGLFQNLEDLQNTYHENKELKTRVEQIVNLEKQVQLLDKDNKELRVILDKKETLRDFKPLQATVIGRNPDLWQEMMIIDKGKTNGIKKNMAVIGSNGSLLGKIKYVNQFSSTVQLLSSADPKNQVSAIIQGDKNVFGLVDGYDKEKRLLVKRIPSDAIIKKGQLVITSGLGEVFPQGLLIGKVEEVQSDQYGLTQTAYVKPGADFYDIENVMVVKGTMMQQQAAANLELKGGGQ